MKADGPYALRSLSLIASGLPICVIDIEMTSPYRDNAPTPLVWSLAAVRMEGQRAVTRMSRLVRIGQLLSQSVATLCGVAPDVAQRSGVTLRDALRDLSVVGESAIWVGHGIDFHDAPILRKAYAAEHIALPPSLASGAERKIDTFRLARELFPTPGKGDHSLSLGALGESLGVPHDPGALHSALADADLCALVLYALLDMARGA